MGEWFRAPRNLSDMNLRLGSLRLRKWGHLMASVLLLVIQVLVVKDFSNSRLDTHTEISTGELVAAHELASLIVCEILLVADLQYVCVRCSSVSGCNVRLVRASEQWTAQTERSVGALLGTNYQLFWDLLNDG